MSSAWSNKSAKAASLTTSTTSRAKATTSTIPKPTTTMFLPASRCRAALSRALSLSQAAACSSPLSSLQNAAPSALRSANSGSVSLTRHRTSVAASASAADDSPLPPLPARPSRVPEPGKPYVITTPLYYANADPHMGSAYTTIAADALARYARIRGASPVRLVTGTDEHGEKIAASAAANDNSTPQAHVDSISSKFSALWGKLDVSADAFVRTTQKRHENLVKAILEKVWVKDDVFKGRYEGWYCVGCEEYKDESDLVQVKNDDDPSSSAFHCPLHAKACDRRSEENYFFRLSRYEQRVRELLEQGGSSPTDSSSSSPETPSSDLVSFVAPRARRNEVSAWASGGLRDFSISRAAVSWGIPVPRDPSQTVYVWFDALLGYASALLTEEEAEEIGRMIDGSPNEPSAGGDDAGASSGAADAAIALLTKKGVWPPSLHVVGKDILRFHAAYWPGMCLSAGLPLPGAVFAHGFLTKDGRKMGKSLGNVLDPNELVSRFGADAVRFYFCSAVAFGSDGDYQAARFADVVNAALANTLGNLVNRSSSLVHKFFGGGVLPVGATEAVAVVDDYFPDSRPGTACKEAAHAAVEAARVAYDEAALHDAAAAAVAAATAGNLALDATAPWSLLKKAAADAEAAAAASVEGNAAAAEEAARALRAGGAALVLALESARISAVCLSPVVPSLSARVLSLLAEERNESCPSPPEVENVDGENQNQKMISWQRDAQWGGLKQGTVLPVPSPVFSRIELTEEEGGAPASGGGKKGGGKQQPKQKQQQKQPKKKKAEAAAASPAA